MDFAYAFSWLCCFRKQEKKETPKYLLTPWMVERGIVTLPPK